MSNINYIDDPNAVDPMNSVGGIELTPEDLQGDSPEDVLDPPDILVRLVNRFVNARSIPVERIAVGQGQIGGSGQQTVMEIVGRQPARRTITIVNTGNTDWEFSGDRNLQPGNGFPIFPDAGFSDLPYNGPLYARMTTAGEVGAYAWIATLEDG